MALISIAIHAKLSGTTALEDENQREVLCNEIASYTVKTSESPKKIVIKLVPIVSAMIRLTIELETLNPERLLNRSNRRAPDNAISVVI